MTATILLLVDDSNSNLPGTQHWAEIKITSLPQKPISNEKLLKIQSNRGPYLNEALLPFKNTDKIRFKLGLEPKTLEAILQCEKEFMWTQGQVLKDIFSWVRFSKREYLQKQDGLHKNELNLKWADLPLVLFAKTGFGSWVLSKLKIFHWIVYSKTKYTLSKTSIFAAITFSGLSTEGLIDAGKSLTNMKLLLAEQGYASQPLTVSTLSYLFQKKNPSLNPNKQQTGRHQSGKLAYEYLLQSFSLPPTCEGLWVFRVGKPEVALPTSLRKVKAQRSI